MSLIGHAFVTHGMHSSATLGFRFCLRVRLVQVATSRWPFVHNNVACVVWGSIHRQVIMIVCEAKSSLHADAGWPQQWN